MSFLKTKMLLRWFNNNWWWNYYTVQLLSSNYTQLEYTLHIYNILHTICLNSDNYLTILLLLTSTAKCGKLLFILT